MTPRSEQESLRSALERRAGFGIALLILGAALIRFYGIGTNPPGLWQDEASTAADAFSLWTTGRDRAGVYFPIISRSFGDYPLALYRYLDAPIVGLFGMSATGERVVAAIAGSLLVVAVGLLALRTLDKTAALVAVVLSALCPTLLQFSRYGSEAILLPLTLVAGWWLIELGRDPKQRIMLWAGATSLALSAYTYHAVKLLLPLWTIGFLIYLAPLIRELWSTRRGRIHLFGPMLLFLLAVAPSVQAALTPEGMARGNWVMAWNHYQGRELVKLVLDNYFSYYDWRVLFRHGGNSPAQSIYGLGVLNWLEAPLLIAGLYQALHLGPQQRAHRFLLYWFLIGPIPGGLTYEPANIGRAIGWFPAPELIAAVGAARIYTALLGQRRAIVLGARALFGVLSMATAGFVIYAALIRYPELAKPHWQFEISGAMKCARSLMKKEKIVVSPQFPFPELFAYFYFRELGTEKKPVYVLEERSEVAPGEIYLFPAADRPKPKGKLLCAITENPRTPPRAFVYGSDGPPL